MYLSIDTRPQRILRSAPKWNLNPASTTSVAQARRQVTRTLRAWGLPELVEDAVLIASELVTNAICHGAAPVWHTMRQLVLADGSAPVCLVVGDGGPGCGPRRSAGSAAPQVDPYGTSGRGLCIVDTLTSAWKVLPGPTGHQVWAELRSTVPLDGTDDSGRHRSSSASLRRLP
jgi:anti-sigma regulatory factor (Ser/Thr protein kinase)